MSGTLVALESAQISATRTQLKGSDVFVRALENEGVQYVFGVPGEENLDLLESLRTSAIRLVVTRHEQAAGFMAATYGRLTGRPGVCLSTLGPGATNLVTAAAYASLGGMPMLMITRPETDPPQPPGPFPDHRYRCHDAAPDQVRATGSRCPQHPDSGPRCLSRCAVRASRPRAPGTSRRHRRSTHRLLRIGAGQLFLSALRRRGRHPGGGPQNRAIRSVHSSCSEPAPTVLAWLPHSLPPCTAWASRSSIRRWARERSTGTPISISAPPRSPAATMSISPATMPTSSLPWGTTRWRSRHSSCVPHGPEVIHVDFNPADIDQIYFPHVEVIGDIADSMTRIAASLEGSRSRLLLLPQGAGAGSRARRRRRRTIPAIRPRRNASSPMCARVMPDDGILCLDNGMYKIWFARNYRTHVSNTILVDNALATMGAGLPSGMMVAMLHPDKRVMAVCGDGGFMMNSQELETAIRLNLNLVVLILEDCGYGMIRWKQRAEGFADFGLAFRQSRLCSVRQGLWRTRETSQSHRRPRSDSRNGFPEGWRPPDHRARRLLREPACSDR